MLRYVKHVLLKWVLDSRVFSSWPENDRSFIVVLRAVSLYTLNAMRLHIRWYLCIAPYVWGLVTYSFRHAGNLTTRERHLYHNLHPGPPP